MDVVNLVSYSFPPQNVPAAHRPYQLVLCLENLGIPYRLYTRSGVFSSRDDIPTTRLHAAAVRRPSSTGFKFYSWFRQRTMCLVEVDKGLLWGLGTAFRLLINLLVLRVRGRRRPIIWCTAPLTTNIYVATFAGILSRSEVHLDLRDLIEGLNGNRVPLLTKLAFRYAKSASVVSPTLKQRLSAFAPDLSVQLAYNGVSSDSITVAESAVLQRSDWIDISYSGSTYDGARPVERALGCLKLLSERLPEAVKGIRFVYAGRDSTVNLAEKYESSRFLVESRGEIDKSDALRVAAESNINLILVGEADPHRHAIPLKTFDLLGVGRPVLCFGPAESDAGDFLSQFAAPKQYFEVNTNDDISAKVESLLDWVLNVHSSRSIPISEPSATSQCQLIVDHMRSIEAQT